MTRGDIFHELIGNDIVTRTEAGTITKDKVFLLSRAELVEYFGQKVDFDGSPNRTVHPTMYAIAQGCSTEDNICAWWLRTIGTNPWANRVSYGGDLTSFGISCRDVHDYNGYFGFTGVRPALWVKIDSDAATQNSESNVVKISDAKVGSYVTFGSYEQDNDTENGAEAIEWLVLNVETGKALLLSRYGLDAQPYHTKYEDVTWKTCSLRNWLNSTFYNAAFSRDQQNHIMITTVHTDNQPSTTDKVFLLSLEETEKYFVDDYYKIKQSARPTYYAVINGAYFEDSGCLWLRSSEIDDAAYINFTGRADSFYSGYYEGVSIRPAIWINLSQ